MSAFMYAVLVTDEQKEKQTYIINIAYNRLK